MNIAFRSGTALCVPSASRRWLSPGWNHTFRILSLSLTLKSLGSIQACSHAVKDREAACKGYKSFQTPENHALYISARNRIKSILRLTKSSNINKKYANLSNSNFSKDLWHLTKNISNSVTFSSFPPLLNPDGSTAVTSTCKAELFAHTFSANSPLDDSGHIPPIYTLPTPPCLL